MGFRQIWTVSITMHDVPSRVSRVEKGASLPSPPAAAPPNNDSYYGHVDRVYEPHNGPQRGLSNHGGNNTSSGNNHALHKIPVCKYFASIFRYSEVKTATPYCYKGTNIEEASLFVSSFLQLTSVYLYRGPILPVFEYVRSRILYTPYFSSIDLSYYKSTGSCIPSIHEYLNPISYGVYSNLYPMGGGKFAPPPLSKMPET